MNEQPQYYRVEPISVKPEKEGWYFTFKEGNITMGSFSFCGQLFSLKDRSHTHWMKPLDPEEGVWMTEGEIYGKELLSYHKGVYDTSSDYKLLVEKMEEMIKWMRIEYSLPPTNPYDALQREIETLKAKLGL